MDLQSIIFSSVAMFSVSLGVTVLGSYVAYRIKNPRR